jgi:hypothetical protein
MLLGKALIALTIALNAVCHLAIVHLVKNRMELTISYLNTLVSKNVHQVLLVKAIFVSSVSILVWNASLVPNFVPYVQLIMKNHLFISKN